MLVLGTTHSIRVVTSPATDVDVYASFVDKTGSTMAAAIQATSITTAATTTVVSAPSATHRGVLSLVIRNRDTTDVAITVQLYDGSNTYELVGDVLYRGEEVSYTDQTGWYRTRPLGVTRQVFATAGSGTYTTPIGVTSIMVECHGGGGGGGGSGGAIGGVFANGGGGGAGGYSKSIIASPASSYSYSVGAAGTAGQIGGTIPGGAGGATTFNTTTVVANGGLGGNGSLINESNTTFTADGGAAGALGTGDQTSRGYAGDSAMMTITGMGGASVFAGGGNTLATGTGIDGSAGSGGGGGGGIGGLGDVAGGAGGAGLLIVTEFR